MDPGMSLTQYQSLSPIQLYLISIRDSFWTFFTAIGSKLSSFIALTDKRWIYHDLKRLHLNNSLVWFEFQAVIKLLQKHFKTLKTNTGVGPDQFPLRMMKDYADKIVQPLCYLINLSLQTYTFSRKVARVTPVFKSKDECNTIFF